MIEQTLERIAKSLERIADSMESRSGSFEPQTESVSDTPEPSKATGKKVASKKTASKKTASKKTASKKTTSKKAPAESELEFEDADEFKDFIVNYVSTSGVEDAIKHLRAFIASLGYKGIAEVDPDDYDKFYNDLKAEFAKLLAEDEVEEEDESDDFDI